MTEVCDHGRPVEGGDWIRGLQPCDDCHDAEWARARPATVVGLIILVALIWTPLVLLLAGYFW